jgi:O-succinylbenzoate synthase
MRTLIDFDGALVFAIPFADGSGVREGVLLEGPQGWGEFSPLPGSTSDEVARWLTAATEPGTVAWPEPIRGRIPVAATIPAVSAALAGDLTRASGCATAEVVVGARPDAIDEDVARLVAVRAALGDSGSIRCRVDGAWDVATATAAIGAFADAVGDLQFVEQPCRTLTDVGEVRRRVAVPVAVRISAGIPVGVDLGEVADVAVLVCGLTGGVRRGLRLAETIDVPCVVSSTAETTIGLAAGVALAGALPKLDFACALGTRALLAGDVVSPARSLMPRDGHLPVAPMPPAPDPALVDRYAITDPARVQWWRRLLRTATT